MLSRTVVAQLTDFADRLKATNADGAARRTWTAIDLVRRQDEAAGPSETGPGSAIPADVLKAYAAAATR